MNEKQKNKRLEDGWYKRVEEDGKQTWKQIDESEIADKEHERSDWHHEFNFEPGVDYLEVKYGSGIRETKLRRKRHGLKIHYERTPDKNKKHAEIFLHNVTRAWSGVTLDEYIQQRNYALVINGTELKHTDTIYGSCEKYLDEKGLDKLEEIAAKYAKTMKEENVKEFSIGGGQVKQGYDFENHKHTINKIFRKYVEAGWGPDVNNFITLVFKYLEK